MRTTRARKTLPSHKVSTRFLIDYPSLLSEIPFSSLYHSLCWAFSFSAHLPQVTKIWYNEYVISERKGA